MTSSTTIYDSDLARRPLVTELKNLWGYRGLLRLLVGRDLTIRYKRSALGVWWTLLNPLLTTGVMWLIFSQVFRFEIPDTPFVVYLLSGILLVTFFGQAVIASGSSIVNSSNILSKVYVPPEIFSVSTATAAAVNFLLSLVPLLVIQVITGLGIPWTIILVPIPTLALLALSAGLGMLVASMAVYYFDVIDFTAVLIQLVSYLTPTFYPLAIVPEGFQWVIKANPLYSYLVVFRGFVYEGRFAETWNFAYMSLTAIVALVLGVWVFSRSWKNLLVNL
jgi:ABC-type polysaccharide/polyol phosphate export permease